MRAPPPYMLRSGSVHPTYLGPSDLAWINDVLDARERFAGRRAREWSEFWDAEPVPHAPPRKLVVVLEWLDRELPPKPAALAARRAREAVFVARGRSSEPRDALLAGVAAELGRTTAELEDTLFSDIHGERRLVPLPARLREPGTAVAHANLAIACSLLRRATQLTLKVREHSLALVRRARASGLIVTVDEADASPLIFVSGPLSILRRTTLYGRALASLVATLPACGAFSLSAPVVLRPGVVRFEMRDGDAELPAAPDAPDFDSRVEERFARDVARLAPRLSVVREPEPVRAGGTLIFPDFALFDPLTPARRRLVEIVGFWTPEYLARKLARLRDARVTDLLVCVDDDLACGAGELPRAIEILRFHRRVDAHEVLTRLGFL